MKEKIIKYWKDFYSNVKITTEQSPFADYVLQFVNKHAIKGRLIDIGCGNGRDSSFFFSNGLDTTGIDIASKPDFINFNFINCDLLDYDYKSFKIIYLRFLVHTLNECEFLALLKKIEKVRGAYIFIETRSSKGVTDQDRSVTFFKSSVGDRHFRMLYSKKYFDELLSSFNIIESSEDKYSKFGSDDPFCLRYVMKNNQ